METNYKPYAVILFIFILIILGIIFCYEFTMNLITITETEEHYLDVSGNATKIIKVNNDNKITYYITFDFNNTYHISSSAINWKLGNYYNMTLYTYKNYDIWYIYEYEEIEEIK
jgi:hypothetical protein